MSAAHPAAHGTEHAAQDDEETALLGVLRGRAQSEGGALHEAEADGDVGRGPRFTTSVSAPNLQAGRASVVARGAAHRRPSLLHGLSGHSTPVSSPAGRPGTAPEKYSWPASPASCSLGGGQTRCSRFTPEEKNCFRRNFTPSSSCEEKLAVYFRTTGLLRSSFAKDGLNQLPVQKGPFYHHPAYKERQKREASATDRHRGRRKDVGEAKVEHLPQEAITAAVLEEIFPRSPADAGANARARRSVDSGLDPDSPGAWTASASPESTPNGAPEPSVSGTAGRTGGLMLGFSGAGSPGLGDAALSTNLGLSVGGACGSSLQGSMQTPAGARGGAVAGALGGSLAGGGMAPAPPPMCEFRRQLLYRFPSVKAAFDVFATDLPNHPCTRKEWRRILARHGFPWPVILAGDGFLTSDEFHVAVEAAAPLRTLEDLRRRLLASGFGSMLQAIAILDDNGVSMRKRMALKEFQEQLSRLRITDPGEVASVFGMVCTDDSSGRYTISPGEVASALATVSPYLLLEDLRDRLVQKYKSVEKAFSDIDHERCGRIALREWMERVPRRFGLTENEASLAFRQIDINGNREITSFEFRVSLGLSEPLLYLEDLRRKVRQRYRSIQQVLEGAFAESTEDDPLRNCPVSLQKLQRLLAEVELDDEDAQMMFDIVDVDLRGSVTVREFLNGIIHFAPSVVLEDVRLAALQKHMRIEDAFDNGSSGGDRAAPLDFQTFRKLLEDASLLGGGVRVQAIFDLLDVKNDGTVSMGRLLAAMQTGAPGGGPGLPMPVQRALAEASPKANVEPIQRRANELRKQVRLGAAWCAETPQPVAQEAGEEGNAESREGSPESEAAVGGAGASPRSLVTPTGRDSLQARAVTPGSAAAALGARRGRAHLLGRRNAGRKHHRSQERSVGGHGAGAAGLAASRGTVSASALEEASGAAGVSASASAPRLRLTPHEVLAPYVENLAFRVYDPKKTSQASFTGTQTSWNGVWWTLTKSPGAGSEERLRIEKDLHAYFQSATYSLSHDVPLLQDKKGYHALHLATRAHHEALRPSRVLRERAKEMERT
eukprot:TRINITY_DN23177_c0_g1_i1.p1 TRINITY_DN23177_c0_g1~~TRINITY_DN23177_c0_g1_i1.p1  ORF type:complete len:1057 (+),score=222.75 TRINITY_DN23177_c0_g1_i1:357-3527(+)